MVGQVVAEARWRREFSHTKRGEFDSWRRVESYTAAFRRLIPFCVVKDKMS